MVGDEVIRQRTAPPIDRSTARRGPSSGGRDTPNPRTLAPGMTDDRARYNGASFDGRIVRDRTPYYEHPRYIPPPRTWINWTMAGPIRLTLAMRQATWRKMVGTDRSRYPVVQGAPTTGMHTMTPAAADRTVARYQRIPARMLPARVDRLSPARYSGQTYSATTTVQGG